MISGIADALSQITEGEDKAKQSLSGLVDNQSPELIRAIEVTYTFSSFFFRGIEKK